jgi:tRNA 2-selenouridine synthase
VPGAINIPLFSDQERAEVGTLYKQVGPEQAKDRGLEFVSPKLPGIVTAIKGQVATKRPVVLYCWRGGMRSASVAAIAELMGVQVYRLHGGYKAFRHYVLESLEQFPLKPQVIVLCGSTGVGKTTLLKMLAQAGEAVIDLEGIANHRGSAFGHVGLGKPSTAQNFDSMLLEELLRFNDRPTLLVECESKRIGNVYLPQKLYQAMQSSKKILAAASLEVRSERLIREYQQTGVDSDQAVIGSIRMLSKRLGERTAQRLIDLYQSGEVNQVVEFLLAEYYDPLYGYEQSNPEIYDLCVDATNLQQAARAIQQYIISLGGISDANSR